MQVVDQAALVSYSLTLPEKAIDLSRSYTGLTSSDRNDRRVLQLFCVDDQGQKLCDLSSDGQNGWYSLSSPALDEQSIDLALQTLTPMADDKKLFLTISTVPRKALFVETKECGELMES